MKVSSTFLLGRERPGSGSVFGDGWQVRAGGGRQWMPTEQFRNAHQGEAACGPATIANSDVRHRCPNGRPTDPPGALSALPGTTSELRPSEWPEPKNGTCLRHLSTMPRQRLYRVGAPAAGLGRTFHGRRSAWLRPDLCIPRVLPMARARTPEPFEFVLIAWLFAIYERLSRSARWIDFDNMDFSWL